MTAKNVNGNGLAPIEQDVTSMESKHFQKIHESLEYISNISVGVFEKYRKILWIEQVQLEETNPQSKKLLARITELNVIIALKEAGAF